MASPSDSTRLLVRVCTLDQMYKTLHLGRSTTVDQFIPQIALKFGLAEPIAAHRCVLIYPNRAGTPKAMTCEGSQLLADLMELQELRVQGWLPKSLKLPPGSCVKLMFIRCSTPLDLSGEEFQEIRDAVLRTKGISEQPFTLLPYARGRFAGYLLKQCKRDPTIWRRKWFFVQGQRLFSCSHPAASAASRVKEILLEEAQVGQAAESKLSREQRWMNCFEINTRRQVYLLRAPSKENMTAWIKELQALIHDANDLSQIDGADGVIAGLTKQRAVQCTDTIRAAAASLTTLIRHPHTLVVLGRFMRRLKCDDVLLCYLDAEAFYYGCAAVWRLLGLCPPARTEDADFAWPRGTLGDPADTESKVQSRGTREIVPGITVDLGTDEDVAVAAAGYRALLCKRLWIVAAGICSRYMGKRTVDVFSFESTEAVELETAFEAHIKARAHPTLSHEAFVEPPSPCLFAGIARRCFDYMDGHAHTRLRETEYYWSLLHSLALQTPLPKYSREPPHAVHWKEWIPEFDLLAFNHSRRKSRRQPSLGAVPSSTFDPADRTASIVPPIPLPTLPSEGPKLPVWVACIEPEDGFREPALPSVALAPVIDHGGDVLFAMDMTPATFA